MTFASGYAYCKRNRIQEVFYNADSDPHLFKKYEWLFRFLFLTFLDSYVKLQYMDPQLCSYIFHDNSFFWNIMFVKAACIWICFPDKRLDPDQHFTTLNLEHCVRQSYFCSTTEAGEAILLNFPYILMLNKGQQMTYLPVTNSPKLAKAIETLQITGK